MKKVKYLLLLVIISGCMQVNALSFNDVKVGDSYYDAVNWASENGVTYGTGNSKFKPNNNCSRAEFVTFMWRASSSPVSSKEISFKDVKSNSYYYNAVRWASENGITSGTSSTTFSPNKALTNSEAITFLYRLSGSPSVSGDMPFKDVKNKSYYYNAVLWAYQNNVIDAGSYFYPNKKITRGKAIEFIYNKFSSKDDNINYGEISGTYYSPLQGVDYANSCYQYETTTPGCGSSKKVVHDISVLDSNGNAIEGSSIYAAANGTAIFYQVYSSRKANMLISYGNYVKLYTNDGNTIIYAHLQKFSDDVEKLIGHSYSTCPKDSSKVGSSAGPCPQSAYSSSVVKYVTSKKITKGELLGYLGSTGNAAMPHLHVEIKYKGSCVTNAYNDYFGMNYSSSSFGNLSKCDMVDIYNKQYNNSLSSSKIKAICNWYGKDSSSLCN